MPKYQYRISTDGNWQSNYGVGLFVIQNKSGSSKKFTIRSLECQINSIAGGATVSQIATASLFRSTSLTSAGQEMLGNYIAMNSVNTLPSTVKVRRYGEVGGTLSKLKTFTIARSGAAAGTQNTLNNQRNFGAKQTFGGGLYNSALVRNGTAGLIEPITVSAGTGVSLINDVVNQTSPVKVDIQVSVNAKIFVWSFFVNNYPGLSLFSLDNATGSTDVVKLMSIKISETGTTDTPYIRVVPVGQLSAEFTTDNSLKNFSAMPMDSTYPAANTWLELYSDIKFIPFGVPESYLTETTAGIPRGFNYLQTKDFNGPNYRCFFPELAHIKPNGANNDTIGFSYGMKNADLGLMKSDIVINQGEGIAIIASCETAASGQPAFSGWTSLTFAAQIDIENQFTPRLNITGLQANSEVRIYNAGTTTELTGIENSSTSFSWEYDYNVYTAVDIVIHALGYKYLRYDSIAINQSGVTLPVSQQIDRVYSNV